MRANSQLASWPSSTGGDRCSSLVELGKQRPRSLEERPSFLGELQCARSALEQTQVEAGLQFRNSAGQGRLRAPGGACGPSEPSVLGDKIEISEGEQIHVFHQ